MDMCGGNPNLGGNTYPCNTGSLLFSQECHCRQFRASNYNAVAGRLATAYIQVQIFHFLDFHIYGRHNYTEGRLPMQIVMLVSIS